ncbi:MAG TPA: tetratricopeptide repeat protein [Gemmatimonadaceae bacterium]|nr:tetratricopeptide repeat protein [Gemmatimonadaceae bacterium]
MTKTGEAARPTVADEDRSVADLARDYGRNIAIGLIALAAAAGIYIAYAKAKASKADKAESAYASAQRSAMTGNPALAQSDLKKVVGRYEGTAAATRAQILMAELLFDEGKFAEGMAELDRASKSGPPDELKPTIEILRAAGLEEQQKFADAAASYLKAAEASRFENDKLKLRADAARAYTEAGNKAEARKIWEELAKDQNSPVAGEARVRLGELTATPSARG